MIQIYNVKSNLNPVSNPNSRLQSWRTNGHAQSAWLVQHRFPMAIAQSGFSFKIYRRSTLANAICLKGKYIVLSVLIEHVRLFVCSREFGLLTGLSLQCVFILGFWGFPMIKSIEMSASKIYNVKKVTKFYNVKKRIFNRPPWGGEGGVPKS